MTNYIGNAPAPDGLILVGDTNPVGAINWFHAPPGGDWLRLNGQVVMKATYPELWAWAQGFLTADQAVNPGLYREVDANTFALPNLDGLFIRSLGGIAPNASAALGVKQADDFKSHTHTYNAASPQGGGVSSGATPNNTGSGLASTATGGVETRPVNVALIACVKALRTVLMPAAAMPPTGLPKAVTFTRDTALASGNQAVVGVGFKPSRIDFFGTITPGSAVGQACYGSAANGVPIINALIAAAGNVVANSWVSSHVKCVAFYETAANAYEGAVASFDPDGFTVAWVKSGAKSGMVTILALCSR
jgi:hypothetical protein